MIRLALVAALAAATAAECGAENEAPKVAAPPFDWSSLDASSTAPTASTGAAPAADPTEARVAILKKLDAALAGTDGKAYAELFASDATAMIPGISDWKGRDDIAAMHAKIFHAFDDTKVGASRVFLKKDRAAVEWVLTGTHVRTWLGVPATSKPVALQALTVYTFDADGRVKTAHIYFDAVAVMAQVGATVTGFDAGPVPKLPATTDVIVAQGTPEEDANAAANEATGKALEQGNVDALAAFVADDVETFRIGEAPTKGRDAVKKAFEQTIKATSDRKATIDDFAAKTFVIEELTFTAINSGPIRGAAPTKKPVTFHSAAILEMKDKRVVRQWDFRNRAELLAQLGVKFAR